MRRCSYALRWGDPQVYSRKVIAHCVRMFEKMPEPRCKECDVFRDRMRLACEDVSSERRLRYPVKLMGGMWQRISWDQAIDEIGNKLLEIRAKSGPESVYWLGSAKFTIRILSPNIRRCRTPDSSASPISASLYRRPLSKRALRSNSH
jgi:Molybdopterin oxidoreductase